MNITFLIGNGFDLNCGLKTSYYDIYKEYVREPSSSEIIARFKNDLWNNIMDWGDFEVAMSKYMKQFSTEKEFLFCLRDFIRFTELYLLEEEKKIINIDDDRIKNRIGDEMIRSFSEFNKGVTHTLDSLEVEHEHANAIIFNYTSTFDKAYEYCYSRYPSLERIIHIHGKLNDDVVMGMDNMNQIFTPSYSLTKKGQRAFIKSFFNEIYDPNRLNDAISCISDSNIICVFGMSLGESDLRWRNLLLEWLLSDSNSHLFIYQYDCSSLPRLQAEERMDKEDDKKIELLKYWGISGDDVDNYFDRIHIPCYKNIFNIGEAITEEKLRILAQERVEIEEINRLRNRKTSTVLNV